jgi:hypothetical protein
MALPAFLVCGHNERVRLKFTSEEIRDVCPHGDGQFRFASELPIDGGRGLYGKRLGRYACAHDPLVNNAPQRRRDSFDAGSAAAGQIVLAAPLRLHLTLIWSGPERPAEI